MHIGIDGNEANISDRVGSNIYAYQLLNWFYSLGTSDQYTIYLKHRPLPEFPPPGEKWGYRVLLPRLLWTRWRLPLELYLTKARPDVFFTPGHYAPRYCPVPLAISIMDLSFLHYPKLFRVPDLYKLSNWTKAAVSQANHIFTISQFSKSDIIRTYSIPEEKVTVTRPGFDKERFSRPVSAIQVERLKREYGIEGKYFLYIGTLQPRKNLILLTRAFSKLTDTTTKLVIVGKKGWMYSDILSEGVRLGVSDRVIFTGYVKDDSIPVLLAGTTALVLVSLYEGFGIPVLEAMAMGIPVVVSQSTSLTEIASGVGIFVNPNQVKSITRGLTRALQLNEDQRNEISVKSKRQAKLYSWKKAAEVTLEVLHAIAI